MVQECWIPPYEECNDLPHWGLYEESLYRIFRESFILNKPFFQGMVVRVRANPKYDSKEESFWHLTCRDYSHQSGLPSSREPDLERCRRIRWPRAFIENYDKCTSPCSCGYECNGVYIWETTHKPKKGSPKQRVKLFLEEESYLVILEKRRDYYLLITAYQVTDDSSLRGIKREMKKKEAKYAGSAG